MVFSNFAFATCFPPFDIVSSETTQVVIDVSWSDFSSEATGYELSYVLTGQDPDYSFSFNTTQKHLVVEDLSPSTSYDFYIRTICGSDSTPWTGPVTLTTVIDNETACNTNIPIDDNNCPDYNEYSIELSSPASHLGDDVFLDFVDIIVEHGWPADLTIKLLSPSGAEVTLIQNRGIGQQNLGNPELADCSEPLRFTNLACQGVDQNGIPIVGSFKPEQSFSNLYDNSDPDGIWTLQVCDKAMDQSGIIKHIKIGLSDQQCEAPDNIFFQNISNQSADIIIPEAVCDSIFITYESVNNNNPIIVKTDCDGDTLEINNLDPNSNYELTYQVLCGSSLTDIDCVFEFETDCDVISTYDNFDGSPICSNQCDSICDLQGLWKNNTVDGHQWITTFGTTPTEFTGPESDFTQLGNYVYVESSPSDCTLEPAILQSSCLSIVGNGTCDMSFAYMLYGTDIDSLTLEISTDGGLIWERLWVEGGNQGQVWKTAQVDLLEFDGMIGQLRFVASSNRGEYGDIALDEIKMFGSSILDTEMYTYYEDQDGDQFGNPEVFILHCDDESPTGYVADNNDCNDLDDTVNPAATEHPCNIVDDNCNGEIDETQGQSDLAYNIIEVQDETCFSLADGIISLKASGGVEPYIYLWADGTEADYRNDLAAGTYVVTITDQSGCKIITEEITVDVIQVFDNLTWVPVEATCQGVFDGAIKVVHDMTSAPFEYEWSNGDTTQSLGDVTTGNYSLTITDVIGCKIELDDLIVPGLDSIDIFPGIIKDASCFGFSDGEILVNASGGTGPYDFEWQDDQSTNPLRTNLIAGSYTVKATDDIGCYTEETFPISQPDSIGYTIIENTSVACFGESTGGLNISMTGGSEPYKLLWNTGDTSTIIQDIPTGFYSFSASDATGCTNTFDSIFVNESPDIEITNAMISPAYCLANNSGELSISVEGGSGVYEYFWNDPDIDEPQATGLPSGDYQVTIIDEFGCKKSSPVYTIENEYIALGVETSILDIILCHDDENASVAIEATNETEFPISFQVNDESYSSPVDILQLDNLGSGLYEIQITDANLCESAIIEFTLDNPPPIDYIVDSINQTGCTGDQNGYISLQTFGGTGSLDIKWNNGSNLSTISELPAGTYQATITDDNSCMLITEEIELIEVPPLQSSIESIQHPLCQGTNDGMINLNISGGLEPYQINWEEPIDGFNVDNLAPGTYHYMISDSSNCSVIQDSIVINSPPIYEFNIIEVDSSLCNQESGGIEFEIIGGVGISNVTLENEPLDSFNIENLAPGTYTLEASDESGCVITQDIEIIQNLTDLNLQVSESLDPKCFYSTDGQIQVQINPTIEGPYLWSVNGETFVGTASDTIIEQLPAGEYDIFVEDQYGCQDSLETITLTLPDPIIVQVDSTMNSTCFGAQNGLIHVSATGGTGDLSILWNNGLEDFELNELTTGEYTAAVSDQNECVVSIEKIVLIAPDSLFLETLELNQPSCPGLEDGSITLNPSGGTEPYSIDWDEDYEGFVLDNLPAGTYHYTFQDSSDCPAAYDSIIVKAPEPLAFSEITTKDSYCNLSNGFISFQAATGGTGFLSYFFEGNQLDNNFVENLPGGQYQITVKDANGCELASPMLEIQDFNIDPDLKIISTGDVLCNNDENGFINVSVNDQLSPPFAWTLDGEETISNENERLFEDLESGIYNLFFIDEKGCKDSIENININNPAPISYKIDSMKLNTCHNTMDGFIALSAAGGTGEIKYLWNQNQDEDDRIIDSLMNGSYICAFLDQNGCLNFSDTIKITNPDSLYLESTTQDAQEGQDDGIIDVSVFGGQEPYSFNWENPIQNETTGYVDMLPAGTYFLNLEDHLGCVIDTSFTIKLLISTLTSEQEKINFYPNPINEYLIIDNNSTSNVEASILSVTGQVLHDVFILPAGHAQRVELDFLHKGFYIIKFRKGSKVWHQGFIKVD